MQSGFFQKVSLLNIKTKLRIALLFICLTFLVIGIFNYLFFSSYKQSLNKAAIAHNIALEVFERRFLADEYILSHTERAKTQWLSKQNNFENKLDAYAKMFRSAQEKDLFSVIKDSATAGKEVFDQLIKLYESELPAVPDDLIRQKESRLSSQLLVNAQRSISAATNLAEMHNKNMAGSFRRIVALFSVSSFLLLATLLTIFKVIWKSASELYERKIKDEAILNGIGDGVVAIDRAWNIILFNKAASDICGWTHEEAIGKPFRSILKFVRESDREENIEFIEQAMVWGKVHFMEDHTVLVRKDGSEVPIGDSAAPIKSENGQVTGAVIIFRDMTREREAARLKSDFAYASHQFRTPVTRALWSMEVVLEGSGINREKRNLLLGIYLAIKSIGELSSQLLEISEIDQGRIMMKLEDINFADSLNRALNLLEEARKQKNIVLKTELARDLPRLNTDSKLFEKVLFEVVGNAIEYGKKDSEVNIDASLQGDNILVLVKDSGIGIPQDQQQLIFTKFFRGKNIPENSAGAGLGLYIAREYIKMMGGKIWFESKDGKGTIFSILLPKTIEGVKSGEAGVG